jgi:hypothetical protein
LALAKYSRIQKQFFSEHEWCFLDNGSARAHTRRCGRYGGSANHGTRPCAALAVDDATATAIATATATTVNVSAPSPRPRPL